MACKQHAWWLWHLCSAALRHAGDIMDGGMPCGACVLLFAAPGSRPDSYLERTRLLAGAACGLTRET